ncbi:MAG TPA: hypothetical protein VFE41_02805 [Acetobacteraceae bacterium]|jgi:uncharacterized protein YigA (DUF484 family)|nr:hypothetical protein [Acetobacteraceae bacterium]
MTAARPLADAAGSDQVAAFLRANPAWLAEHPELYRLLAPPRRVHGEVLSDHMAAMLQAERAHASELIDAGRAAAGMAGRVQEGVLALMRAADPAECVSGELPGLLGIDAAALCAEEQHAVWHQLPPGTVRRLLDGRDVVFRAAGSDALMLHAEAARLALHDALVRVPGAGTPMLLALASRDARALDPAQGSNALGFLGRAVAAALGR